MENVFMFAYPNMSEQKIPFFAIELPENGRTIENPVKR
jgi:hypothetical protein